MTNMHMKYEWDYEKVTISWVLAGLFGFSKTQLHILLRGSPVSNASRTPSFAFFGRSWGWTKGTPGGHPISILMLSHGLSNDCMWFSHSLRLQNLNLVLLSCLQYPQLSPWGPFMPRAVVSWKEAEACILCCSSSSLSLVSELLNPIIPKPEISNALEN